MGTRFVVLMTDACGDILAADGDVRASRDRREGRPSDAFTFMSVFALLTSVAVLASYVPARRASRIDPMAALRAN